MKTALVTGRGLSARTRRNWPTISSAASARAKPKRPVAQKAQRSGQPTIERQTEARGFSSGMRTASTRRPSRSASRYLTKPSAASRRSSTAGASSSASRSTASRTERRSPCTRERSPSKRLTTAAKMRRASPSSIPETAKRSRISCGSRPRSATGDAAGAGARHVRRAVTAAGSLSRRSAAATEPQVRAADRRIREQFGPGPPELDPRPEGHLHNNRILINAPLFQMNYWRLETESSLLYTEEEYRQAPRVQHPDRITFEALDEEIRFPLPNRLHRPTLYKHSKIAFPVCWVDRKGPWTREELEKIELD